MGKKSDGGNEAALARSDEQARQERVRQGTTSIDDIFASNFNDNFFTGRSKAYTDYANPQLDQQYGDAQKQLTFALDRSGLLDSSARGEKVGQLQKLYDTNRQAITDQGVSLAGETKNNVESARAGLISTLNATGDAEGAANSALTRASALSTPTAFSPLSELFANFTAGLGTQAALERASSMSGGSISPRYNTGLFGTRGSVRVS